MIIYTEIDPIKWRGHPVLNAYRISNRTVWIDHVFPELDAFAAPEHQPEIFPTVSPQIDLDGEQVAIYEGPGWIGGKTRQFVLTQGKNGYHLTIEGFGRFYTSKDGSIIYSLKDVNQLSIASKIEAILGPAMILALALQGAWCLHASAAVFQDQAIALLGESGRGKSTLAWYLSSDDSPGWQRTNDDVLPVSQLPDGVFTLPHFPQLKLPRDDQPVYKAPEKMPLKAIYILSGSAKPEQPIRVQSIPPAQAVLSLVRNTIAARLFDKELLSRHLVFCQVLAQSVPLQRLSYPHDYDRLAEVRRALITDLEGLS